MTEHPAKTDAQRVVLDRIGCGDHCPPMSKQTRESMLTKGLIVKVGTRKLGNDRFGGIEIPQFEMPIPVHMQWCAHQAEQHVEEE